MSIQVKDFELCAPPLASPNPKRAKRAGMRFMMGGGMGSGRMGGMMGMDGMVGMGGMAQQMQSMMQSQRMQQMEYEQPRRYGHGNGHGNDQGRREEEARACTHRS